MRTGYTCTRLPCADSDLGVTYASGQVQTEAEEGGSPSENGQHKDNKAESTVEEEEGEEDAEEGEEERIILRIKSSSHTEGLRLRIGVSQPLQRLFNGYKKQGHKAGWLPDNAKVTFKFDGDAMDGSDTPKVLDMEDEDVIDACW